MDIKWLALSAVLSTSSLAASLPPSNLWLFELNTASAEPTIISARKLTDTLSYTSQPHFVKQSDHLYYSQAFTHGDAEQTDTMRYDVISGFHKNLTNSPESEYSPTPLPSLSGFSAIRVDKNNKQWLWQYNSQGKAQHRITDIEPVGYQVWVSEDSLLAFVLGAPNTLQLLTLSGHQKIIDEHIGASLWRIPQTDMFSYTKNPAPDSQPWTLMAYDPQSQDSTVLVTLPRDAYYMAWANDGRALTAVGSQILAWDFTQTVPASSPSAAVLDEHYTPPSDPLVSAGTESEWNKWLDLTQHCPGGVSRLHLREDSRYLAVICNEQQP